MAVAAVTPRVRTIVVCDDVAESQFEDGVFTLEGVRQQVRALSFPCRVELSLFMALSSPRKGQYSGRVLIVKERNDRCIRYAKFVADFDQDNEILPLCVELGDCSFPEAGRYNFEIYFAGPNGGEALKAEHPFAVVSPEE